MYAPQRLPGATSVIFNKAKSLSVETRCILANANAFIGLPCTFVSCCWNNKKDLLGGGSEFGILWQTTCLLVTTKVWSLEKAQKNPVLDWVRQMVRYLRTYPHSIRSPSPLRSLTPTTLLAISGREVSLLHRLDMVCFTESRDDAWKRG